MHAFGPFTVDVTRRFVAKNGTPLRLSHKCVELLVAFVENPGRTLGKEELIEAAWHDPRVSDATLAQHVFLLRRALRHEDCSWIATVSNRGYRFTAQVTERAAPDESERTARVYLESARAFREIGTERALRSAVDLCGHALDLNDGDAAAYALRASCWRLLAESMLAEPLPCLQSARSDAQEALNRDPAEAGVHLEYAFAVALLERDAALAQRHLDAARRLDPEHASLPGASVWLALMDGRTGEAVRIAEERGGELYGAALYMAHQFGPARTVLEQLDTVAPGSRVIRGACRLLAGEGEGALSDFRAAYFADLEQREGAWARVAQYALGLYIYTLAKTGQAERAGAQTLALERLDGTRYVSPMARALAHLGLGERDAAMTLVEEALARFDPWSAYVPVDPMLDELRGHPRFSRLARRAA